MDIKLDKKDKKLLYELDKNSRLSFKQLGKKTGLKKETVFQKIKKFKENKIIDRFQTIINIHALGYNNYRLYLKFRNTDKEIEKQISEFFINSRITGWVVKVEGNWDLGVWFLIKNMNNFRKEYESFKQEFSNYIYDEKLSIFTDVHYYSKSYLINRKNTLDLEIKLLDKGYDLDDKELILLKELARNSRISIIDLSDKTRWSTKTVIKKIKNLEKKKIILGYRLKINTKKLGIEHYKIHLKLNNLNKNTYDSIKDYISLHKNIIYWNNTISGYDLDLDIQVKSKQKLDSLLDDLKEKFRKNIEDYDILTYEREYKQIFLGY